VNGFHSLRLASPWLAVDASPRFVVFAVPADRSDCPASERAAPPPSLPDAGVPALGLPAPAEAAVRASVEPVTACPPALMGEKWFCCIVCCKFAACCSNDCVCAVLCVPKKCCAPPLRMVDGAAARPLADRLARVGTTGKFPVIMRAPLNCSCVAATALTRPVPK
jgi:hypothetical protein